MTGFWKAAAQAAVVAGALFATACAPAQAGNATGRKGAEVFQSFLGLQRGDTEPAVLARFGPPQQRREEKRFVFLSYGDGGLEFTVERKTGEVRYIALEEQALPWVVQRVRDDKAERYLGAGVERVLRDFGPTSEPVRYDVHSYELGGRGFVNFSCYRSSEGACRRIYVGWQS